VITDVLDNIATMTINKPETSNALSSMVLDELIEQFDNISPLVRVLIITGEGDKAFCAGADLKERQGMSDEEAFLAVSKIQNTFQKIWNFPMPTIAAINGVALGGGLELALACDIRLASPHAQFALPECSLGIIPGAGGTVRLPQVIGYSRAAEMIFSAKRIDALEAFNLGLINRVSPDVLSEAKKLALDIAKNAPLSLRAAKKSLRSELKKNLEVQLKDEIYCYEEILHSADRLEGLLSFKEKRKPIFHGR